MTYGIMFGVGASLNFVSSFMILGQYFQRHLGVINGVVRTGSSVFTMAMPHILEILLSTYDVSLTTLIECMY